MNRGSVALLVTGQGLSLFGDGMFAVAVGFAVFAVGGGPLELGIVLLVGVLALFGTILPAGVLVDRVSRRGAVVVADLVRGSMQLASAAIVAWDSAHWWYLLPTSFVFGAATGLNRPAAVAYVAEVVPPAALERVNGALQALRGLGLMLGSAVAGILIATSGVATVIALDATTFYACAACMFVIGARRTAVAVDRGEVPPTGMSELRAAVALLRAERWIAHGVAVVAGFVLVSYAPMQVIGPAISRELVRDGGSEARVWAFVSAAIAVGLIIGGGTALLRGSQRLVGAVRVLLLLGASGPFALARHAPTGVVVLGFVAIGAAMGMFAAGWESTKQRRVPGAMLARIGALDWFLQLTCMLTGVVWAAALTELASPEAALFVVAAGCVTLAVLAGMSSQLVDALQGRTSE